MLECTFTAHVIHIVLLVKVATLYTITMCCCERLLFNITCRRRCCTHRICNAIYPRYIVCWTLGFIYITIWTVIILFRDYTVFVGFINTIISRITEVYIPITTIGRISCTAIIVLTGIVTHLGSFTICGCVRYRLVTLAGINCVNDFACDTIVWTRNTRQITIVAVIILTNGDTINVVFVCFEIVSTNTCLNNDITTQCIICLGIVVIVTRLCTRGTSRIGCVVQGFFVTYTRICCRFATRGQSAIRTFVQSCNCTGICSKCTTWAPMVCFTLGTIFGTTITGVIISRITCCITLGPCYICHRIGCCRPQRCICRYRFATCINNHNFA